MQDTLEAAFATMSDAGEGCPIDLLPLSGEGSDVLRGATRTTLSENDVSLSVNATYPTYGHALKGLIMCCFPEVAGHLVQVQSHYDVNAKYLVGGSADMRPDFVSAVVLRDAGGVESTHVLAVAELKSLNAAPDRAFDALDNLDASQKIHISYADDTGFIAKVESPPIVPYAGGRSLRPRGGFTDPDKALSSALANVADASAYALAMGSTVAMWSNGGRHVPIVTPPGSKESYFGKSRGRRQPSERQPATGDGSESELSGYPSGLFLRLMLDIRALQELEDKLRLDPQALFDPGEEEEDGDVLLESDADVSE